MKKMLIALMVVSMLGGAAFAAPKLTGGQVSSNGFITSGGR